MKCDNLQAYSYIPFEVALSDIHMYSGHYIICRKRTAHAHLYCCKLFLLNAMNVCAPHSTLIPVL